MPYISHSPKDIEEMLARIGVKTIDDLFHESIPEDARFGGELDLAAGASEMEIQRELCRAEHSTQTLDDLNSFLGGGVYDHFIPSVIDHLAGRSEFYTAYTPYQPEASQGMLTAIFEYQSMIAGLTGMDVSNASVYDGASAMAEAVLMSCAIQRRRRKVVVSGAVHPEHLATVRTYLENLDNDLVVVEAADEVTEAEALAAAVDEDTVCVAFQNPNFFGHVEDVFALKEIAHAKGALLIASVDPVSLGVIVPPGEYGADIAIGEGQGLGGEVWFGGPYFGFFAAKKEHVRKMPGRIAGITEDAEGRRGFVLTFQTREQHIRRAKATSNICTNQGIIAMRGAMHLAALGPTGIREAAEHCIAKAHYAAGRIAELPGYELPSKASFVKEFTIRAPRPAEEVFAVLQKEGILPGLPLSRWFPERTNDLLVAVTEKKTKEEIDALVDALGRAAGGER
jgi:glycine dehydrogenase subunit 1